MHACADRCDLRGQEGIGRLPDRGAGERTKLARTPHRHQATWDRDRARPGGRDGALGFWKAIEEVFPGARHQRCWVHKTANVPNKVALSVQINMKADLREIYGAPTRAAADAAIEVFADKDSAKYDKAVACLTKDREALQMGERSELKAVKSKGGAAGVDGQRIEQFEADLKNNLYKIWNRMSSGSYFPPPVRAVSIPKKSGGQRILGVPTVADRVAQMVVKQVIEPDLDPAFLPDSYGYRPRKSALDAVGVTRKRCWKYDWVLEFDIKGLFDNIDHTLLLRAVRKHVTSK